jgi:hypothetical protein
MKSQSVTGGREYAVLVRLSAHEHQALNDLMVREALPGATVLRRLLIQESRRVNSGMPCPLVREEV